MKKKLILLLFVLFFCMAACTGNQASENKTAEEGSPHISGAADTDAPSENPPLETIANQESEVMENEEVLPITMRIGGEVVSVQWENNDSVNALMELIKDKPLTVPMSMYGTFEQVGSLGTNLPREDVQTTTQAGDIVLYSGNQIVVFYGTNAWAYTRLGKITDKTAEQLTELLGNGNVTLTLSMES